MTCKNNVCSRPFCRGCPLRRIAGSDQDHLPRLARRCTDRPAAPRQVRICGILAVLLDLVLSDRAGLVIGVYLVARSMDLLHSGHLVLAGLAFLAGVVVSTAAWRSIGRSRPPGSRWL